MSKVNATQLATIATLAAKGAASLAQTFDAGMKFEEFKAQTTADALELRAYAMGEKIGFDVLFKGNKRTNVIRAKIADVMTPFEAIKGESTVRRYVTAFIATVETGVPFNPSMGNGADKPKAPKADKPNAGGTPDAGDEQNAHSEQNGADAPSAGTVVTKEVIEAGQSEAGNNGPDVQQKPTDKASAKPHARALEILAAFEIGNRELFLLLGTLNQKSAQATVTAAQEEYAAIAKLIQDALK